MSDYIKRQMEARASAWEQAKALLDTAAAENRDLTGEESQKYEAIVADIDQRKQVIDNMLSVEAREREAEEARSGRPESRPFDGGRPVESIADQVRKLARGEIRELSLMPSGERRDVAKSSTGAPVPTSFYDEIMTVARYTGPMLDAAFILQTSSGENLQIPRTNAYSTGSVTAENTGYATSDPTFQSFLTLGAFTESVFFHVTNDLLADDGANLESYLAENIGQAVGYKANAHLTTGTGTTQPTGIVASAGSGVTGSTAVSGAFTVNNVIDLVYSTDAAVRRLPGFGLMGSTSAVALLRKLQDGAGNYVWQPSLQLGQPDRVLGYPVWENPHMAAVATSAKSLIAGNFKRFIVRQVGGLVIETSKDFKFDYDLTSFRAKLRIDSGLPQSTDVKYFAGGAS